MVTKEDLPYIISDVLDSNSYEEKVIVESYVLTHSKGLKTFNYCILRIEGESIEENAQGDGQFDAFMNALKKFIQKKEMNLPNLIDYAVRIPPGSLIQMHFVKLLLPGNMAIKRFKTRGLDSDQTVSAIKATQKMLNIIIIKILNI